MIEDAIRALRDGKFILLYDFDDRERETDFAIRADAVTPGDILVPGRTHYPEDIVELVAPVGLRTALGLKDNDIVTVEVDYD